MTIELHLTLKDLGKPQPCASKIPHPTHDMRNHGDYIDCTGCWGCTCHFPDVLAEPCRHVVDPRDYMPPAKIVVRQAECYGAQIRFLTDEGMMEDRQRVMDAYEAYHNQFTDLFLGHLVDVTCFESYMGNTREI